LATDNLERSLARSIEFSGGTETAGRLQWQHCIWLIALLPAIQAALTWDMDGILALPDYLARHFSIPAVFGEIAIVVIACVSGFSISSAWKSAASSIKILLAVWLFFGFASSLLTDGNVIGSLLMMFRYMLHVMFFAALIHIIPADKSFSIAFWLRVLSTGTAIYIAMLSLFVLLVPEPETFRWALRMPSATNVRQIANIVAILSAAPAAMLLFDRGSARWPYLLLYVAIVAFCGWSGSRTALVAMSAGLIVGVAVCRTMPQWNRVGFIGGSWISGLAIAASLPSPGPDFGLFRILDRMREPANLSSGRVDLWTNTLTEISNNPWLGYGSGSFRTHMAETYGTFVNHPHNFVLQFVYDWGVFGAFAGLALIGLAMWLVWKSAPCEPISGFAAACGFSILLAASAIDGAFYYPLPLIATMCLLAPVYSAARVRRLDAAERT
jgi:O-antigen ligase